MAPGVETSPHQLRQRLLIRFEFAPGSHTAESTDPIIGQDSNLNQLTFVFGPSSEMSRLAIGAGKRLIDARCGGRRRSCPHHRSRRRPDRRRVVPTRVRRAPVEVGVRPGESSPPAARAGTPPPPQRSVPGVARAVVRPMRRLEESMRRRSPAQVLRS